MEPRKTRAPGKVVLSGAYAVLEGARALVTAVDRYVTADAARPASWVTPEVRQALGSSVIAPWFDSSALRHQDRKLGLGSSAAILVASLGALALELGAGRSEVELQRSVFEAALRAHALAQAGGSGVDVAASTFGGTLLVRRIDNELSIESVTLPATLHWEVWSLERSASTRHLIAAVLSLKARAPSLFQSLIDAQASASEEAAAALVLGNTSDLLAALDRQNSALEKLGGAAEAMIITPETRVLAALARKEGAVFLPAGAGGGDVAFYAGNVAPSAHFRTQAALLGLVPLDLALGARGLHSVEP